MRNSNTLIRQQFAIALAALFLIHLPIQPVQGVEETQTSSALATSQHSFQLSPGNDSVALPIVIDAMSSFTFKLLAASQTLEVSIVSPGGARFTVGTPDTAVFQSGKFLIESTTTDPGASYQVTMANPQSGTWTLEVTETGILTGPLNGVVTFLLYNRTILFLAGGGSTYPVDTNVRLAAIVFDTTNKVTGLAIDAEIFRPGDPTFTPESVNFLDNGAGADDIGGDGIYQAFVNLSEAGTYQIQVDATGTASTGAFQRTAATVVKFVERSAQIGSFTDRGIDSDSDGLFNRIGVTPSAIISKAGSYVVGVRLKASNGKTLFKTADAQFAVGTRQVEVLFEADDVIRELGVNGPYQVAEVRFYEMVPGGDLVPADIRYELGSTAAYQIAALQHPPLSLTGSGTATGGDANGNLLFDTLDVTLEIFADFAGNYDYSVSLLTINGKELGFLSSSTFLSVGTNTLELEFPGLPIGTGGIDGPYFISNLLVFNNSHSLISTRALTTSSLKAREFEGYTPPVDLAKLRAKALLQRKIKRVQAQLKKAKDPKKKKRLRKLLSVLKRKLRLLG